MKAYRERIRRDPEKYAEKKEADRRRKKISREIEKGKLSECSKTEAQKLLSKKRLAEREIKRSYRWNIAKKTKSEQVVDEDIENEAKRDFDTPTKVYPSKQAAGKAQNRLRVRLPLCPRKRKAITLKLALEAGNKMTRSKMNRVTMSQDVKDKVVTFYNRDDIFLGCSRYEGLRKSMWRKDNNAEEIPYT